MSYLPKLDHSCISYKDKSLAYKINQCKACKDKDTIKRKMKEFERMMSVCIAWDEDEVLL